MATGEKNHPPYVEPTVQPYPVGAPIGYGGQQPPVAAYYPLPGSQVIAGQPPPAYAQQQTSNVVVVGGAPTAAQNVVVVQTVRANVQIPEVYPGVAFCMFSPGIIETIIRISTMVMLVVLIAVAGAAIDEQSVVVYDDDNDDGFYVDATGWRGAAGWIIFVAGISLITEGIVMLLRFLNPRCFNNSYGVFGGLDITKCVLAGTGLFIGCIITGIESAIAADDIEEYCDSTYRNADNNRACEQLERIYDIVLALTIVNVICMFLLLVLFIWDIIYLSAGLNSKVPVPRGTEQYH